MDRGLVAFLDRIKSLTDDEWIKLYEDTESLGQTAICLGLCLLMPERVNIRLASRRVEAGRVVRLSEAPRG